MAERKNRPATVAYGVSGTHLSIPDRRVAHQLGALDFERVFDGAPIGMSLADLDGRWLDLNAAHCRMLGYDRHELLAIGEGAVIHPEDGDEELGQRAEELRTGSFDPWHERRYVARDGSTVRVRARTEVIRDDDGCAVYRLTVVHELPAGAGVVGAPSLGESRLRSIIDNMRGAVSVKGHDGRYLLVNAAFEQRFGSPAGSIVGRRDDEVLPADMVARDRESDDRVRRTGELVEQEDVVAMDGEDHVLLTVKFPVHGEGDGADDVCGIFNDITDHRRREEELRLRLDWTERIHGAIAQDRLLLFGQPIFDLRTGRLEQTEMLVRMRAVDGSKEMIPPGEFLPAAERFDLVGAVDLWVVAQAMELARDGHRVEVNLSGKTVSDAAKVDAIERLVIDSGAPAENIVFELTETAVAKNMESVRPFAQRLRALGCGFALDDFGVGFGTFTYLKHLPVDFLKIDITFVRDLVRNESDRNVVHAIVGVARDFGMKTIAEGVEDQATADMLRLMRVDYAQGYLFGRPVPVDELWPTPTARTT
jgi:PAS domain S-box-containing protein